MFFKNIATYSKKRLFIITLICECIYFMVTAFTPAVIVCSRYKIFNSEVKWTQKLTGVGIVLFVVIGIYVLRLINNSIKKLKQNTYQQQCFKFCLSTIFDAAPLVLVILAFFCVKDDIDLAFRTTQDCFWCFLVGVLWKGLVLNFLDAENTIRNAAEFDKEKLKRADVI